MPHSVYCVCVCVCMYVYTSQCVCECELVLCCVVYPFEAGGCLEFPRQLYITLEAYLEYQSHDVT